MVGKIESRRGQQRMRWLDGITDSMDMLLLLLSHFSRVRLCANPWTAAHQAPLSTGFSRQEYFSGLPFPSPNRLLTIILSMEKSTVQIELHKTSIYSQRKNKIKKNYQQLNLSDITMGDFHFLLPMFLHFLHFVK